MTNARRRAVAIRHVSFEDLGLLASLLTKRGYDVSYRDAALDPIDIDEIRDADLLVVLGGPIGAYDAACYPFLRDELRLIERRLSRDLPTLGICLGAQLMASALEAKVYPGPIKEIGWADVSLSPDGYESALAPLSSQPSVLHWHGDTFDLPAHATRLAFSAHYENQAFRYGRNGLALQFHLEADPHRIEQWLVGHALELAQAGVSLHALRRETAAMAHTAIERAATIFLSWLHQIEGTE